MSPFNAWILLKGLETLAIRVRAQTETAAAVADALAQHPKISRLIYPRPRRSSAGPHLVKKQMRAGSTLLASKSMRQGGGVPLSQRAEACTDFKQSRRRQKASSPIRRTTTHQRLTLEARAELGSARALSGSRPASNIRDDLIEDARRRWRGT